MSVQHFAHFGICVSDPERSMRFYRDLLGFRPLTLLKVSDPRSAQLVELPGLDLHSYFLERDGVRIELLHYRSPGHEPETVPRPMNRLGLTHMALRVRDLAGLLERFEVAGVEILRQTRVSNPDFGSDVVYVLDPDGLRVELIQLPGDPTQPLGEPIG
jgi:glyoxylase I family protein